MFIYTHTHLKMLHCNNITTFLNNDYRRIKYLRKVTRSDWSRSGRHDEVVVRTPLTFHVENL